MEIYIPPKDSVQQMKNHKSVFAVMGYFKSFIKIWKPFSEETTDFNQAINIQLQDKPEVLNASTRQWMLVCNAEINQNAIFYYQNQHCKR